MSDMRVAQPVETLHGGGIALSCALDGSVTADAQHGLFAADTRVLSTYRITLGGVGLELLSHTRQGHGTALWQFQNRAFRSMEGDVPPGSIFVVLRRRVDGAMHDDLQVTSYGDHLIRAGMVIQLDADFADIFEVKSQQMPPRLGVRRAETEAGVMFDYRRGSFHRGLEVSLSTSRERPTIVGSRFGFDIELLRTETWECCIDAVPWVDGRAHQFAGDPHADEDHSPATVSIVGPDTIVAPFREGCADLAALTVTDNSAPFLAAGAPWFLTLFGRDTLVAALMTGLLGPTSARATLRSLGELQATERDDWRDAEPGKLPHEVRRGELAARGSIPHTPYYGTHDAQALYCLTLWNTWRWTGDRRLLDAHLETARRALRWCDDHGDLDGDGLQEYRTRSRDGYYNQGWKDAHDAIVTDDGVDGKLPLATVDLQAYVYAARLAMAELFDEVGDSDAAATQREQADSLAGLVDRTFFDEGSQFYALALDGDKRRLLSPGSNPGHLLWCGLPTAEGADAVAQRFLEPDLFSGWGLRTLSTEHPSYNPLSYQRGSVWPHDTMLAAAGLFRYGLHDEAATLLRAVLDAACAFEDDRLPELYCGFDRASGPPVPYAEANVPQAWAAAAPILGAQMLLGLVPDAPRNRCFLSPWLPDWLPFLGIRGIEIGDVTLDVELSRRNGSIATDTNTSGDLEVVFDHPPAPLWGRPMRLARGAER